MSERLRAHGLRFGPPLAALVLAAALPTMVGDPVWVGVLSVVLVNACATLGLTLLFGYAGQISLAQAAFFGIGAYAPAIFAVKLGLSPWVGLPVGIAIAAGLAFLIGRPVLRLEGVYLAMATAAVNIVFVVILQETTPVTGGTFGLAGVPPLALPGHSFRDPQDVYYLVLVALAILLYAAHRLTRSPLGLMFNAIGHDSRAAGLAGIPVTALKVKMFALSAVCAAVGGFFLTASLLVVTPTSFEIMPSVFFLVMMVVGGMRSLAGAVAGAAFVTVVPELIPQYPQVQDVLFAVAFMVVIMLMPDGLASIPRSGERLIKAWSAALTARRGARVGSD